MDVVDSYPNTSTIEGRETIAKYSPQNVRNLFLEFHDLVHGSLYQWTPDGLVKVDDRYGIGQVQSGDVCDLDWLDREQQTLEWLRTVQMLKYIMFWCRMVDDYFMALTGSETVKQTIVNAYKDIDPNRPVTVEQSNKSVNYLDITVYKGTRFRQTSKVDTELYTKPSNHELHLPYTSFHPSSTFSSILQGQHKRSLVASTSMGNHVAAQYGTEVQHIPQQSIIIPKSYCTQYSCRQQQGGKKYSKSKGKKN